MKYKLMPEEPTAEMEEALATILDEINDCQGIDGDDFAEILRRVWQAAPDGWISVKDRLPEDDTPVLVYCPDAPLPYGIDYWSQFGLGFYWSHDSEPTHWQPLPEPPKE